MSSHPRALVVLRRDRSGEVGRRVRRVTRCSERVVRSFSAQDRVGRPVRPRGVRRGLPGRRRRRGPGPRRHRHGAEDDGAADQLEHPGHLGEDQRAEQDRAHGLQQEDRGAGGGREARQRGRDEHPADDLADDRQHDEPHQGARVRREVDALPERADGERRHRGPDGGDRDRGEPLARAGAEAHEEQVARVGGRGDQRGHRAADRGDARHRLRVADEPARQRDADEHHGHGEHERAAHPLAEDEEREQREDHDLHVDQHRRHPGPDGVHGLRPQRHVEAEQRAADEQHDRTVARRRRRPQTAPPLEQGQRHEQRERERAAEERRGARADVGERDEDRRERDAEAAGDGDQTRVDAGHDGGTGRGGTDEGARHALDRRSDDR